LPAVTCRLRIGSRSSLGGMPVKLHPIMVLPQFV
jgi:hypothetical protein